MLRFSPLWSATEESRQKLWTRACWRPSDVHDNTWGEHDQHVSAPPHGCVEGLRATRHRPQTPRTAVHDGVGARGRLRGKYPVAGFMPGGHYSRSSFSRRIQTRRVFFPVFKVQSVQGWKSIRVHFWVIRQIRQIQGGKKKQAGSWSKGSVPCSSILDEVLLL